MAGKREGRRRSVSTYMNAGGRGVAGGETEAAGGDEAGGDEAGGDVVREVQVEVVDVLVEVVDVVAEIYSAMLWREARGWEEPEGDGTIQAWEAGLAAEAGQRWMCESRIE